MTRRQRLTLVAAILGSGVATIDGTIVNVALPSIERDLGGGLPAQQWVSNAYLLTLGSLILIGGSLGDIYGERRDLRDRRRRVRRLSVACALAPTIGVLIAARALQGAAGALLTPSSLAIIVAAFPTGERAAAIGIVDGLGRDRGDRRPARGRRDRRPALLALDLRASTSRSVIATLALVLAAVPRTARVAGRAVDVVGAVLCVLGLGGFVFALIEQPRHGWGESR